MWSPRGDSAPVRFLRFLRCVFRSFHKNHGMLLAGALAYYTLLSMIPLLTLLLVGLSHLVDPERLDAAIRSNLRLVVPGQADLIRGQITSFLANRQVIGGVGVLVLLFFSSLAFSVFENAMRIQFAHRHETRRRHFLVSAVLPYLFIMVLALGLLLLTVMSGALQTIGEQEIHVCGYSWSLAGASTEAIYGLGLIGEVLLLSALYELMPVGRTRWHHALIGGLVATALWEVARRVLVWYYANVSMVNLIYGSIAATVVALLTLEVAAVILLFGAQVISEVEQAAARRQKLAEG